MEKESKEAQPKHNTQLLRFPEKDITQADDIAKQEDRGRTIVMEEEKFRSRGISALVHLEESKYKLGVLKTTEIFS